MSVVSLIAIAPSAFADVTVTNAPGSSTPGCEDTNSCFIPNPVTVEVGAIVTWDNTDTAAHTASSGTAADGPSGVWDSSLIMAGGSYSFTFDTAGTYDYFCMVHPWMTGEIIVKDGYGTSHAIEPNSKAKQNFNFYSYGEYRAGEIDCELKHYFENCAYAGLAGQLKFCVSYFRARSVTLKEGRSVSQQRSLFQFI